MDPPVPLHLASYGMQHVTHGARATIGAVARRLVAAGVDVDAKDSDGKTALLYACLGGLEEVTRGEGAGAGGGGEGGGWGAAPAPLGTRHGAFPPPP